MSVQGSNYYEVLGLNQSATADEIRRAYRILARRYHPDLNPGKSSEERFKIIALAYQTLSDLDKKRQYDTEIESARRIRAGFAAYERAQTRSWKEQPRKPRPQRPTPRAAPSTTNSFGSDPLASISSGIAKLRDLFSKKPKPIPSLTPRTKEISTRKVSVIEVSVSMRDALFGGRKSIEIPTSGKTRKLSLRIPAGVRSGSVLRVQQGSPTNEEFVIIIRVALHALIDLSPKGVIIEIPVSISEAIFGASIKVPGIESQETIIIPSGSQSGQEIRVSGQGIKFDDGRRGDLFYRINIQVPISHQAVGLKEKVVSLGEYYEAPMRQGFPASIKESVTGA